MLKHNLLIEFILLFAVFFVQGAWPVPDVNEPYYLGKAIHYWNPDWVRGDFFLESADAHWTFYVAFGWLSLLMLPPVLAWTGRVLTWGLLAWSWQRLSWALVRADGKGDRPLLCEAPGGPFGQGQKAPVPFSGLLSGALFACLMERCHMAGEWVIGGVEAKGFAYVLVFLGLEAMVRDRWNRAWLLWGAASLLHVVVGGWVVVAAGFAWLVSGRGRPSLRSMWPGLLGGLVIALPSLIPLLALNWGVNAATATRAHWIYVYFRLPHHLILSEFRWDFLLRFGVLVVVWTILCMLVGRGGTASEKGTGTSRAPSGGWSRSQSPFPGAQRRLRGFVFGSLAISLVGAVLSELVENHPALAARLLRFYWFRLSDVAIPMGVALFAVLLIDRWLASRPAMGRLALALATVAAVLHVGDFAWLRAELASGLKPAIPRADLKVEKLGGYGAWRDACEWIATSGQIPRHAQFLTPIDGQSFKWLTARAEVVSRKDIPQDAASIVTWWERLRDVHGIGPDEPRRYWYTSLTEISEERLRELGAKYDAAYVLTEAPGVQLPETEISPAKPAPRLKLKPLYENAGYVIYELAQ